MDEKKVIRLVSKFEDKKGSYPYFHAKHYEGGYVVATDAKMIAKCRFDYPDAQEGKTFDNASGREITEKYPPYDDIFAPYRGEFLNESIPVRIDRKKAGAAIKTVQAFPGAEALSYVSVNVDGKTVCFNSAAFSKILEALDLYGIDTIYFRAENVNGPVYAKADDGSEFAIMPVKKAYSDAVLCINGEQDTERLKKAAATTEEGITAEEEALEQTPDKFSKYALRIDRSIKTLRKKLSIINEAIDGITRRPAPAYSGALCFKAADNDEISTERTEDENGLNEANDSETRTEGTAAALKDGENEVLDGTTADDVDRRMLAQLRKNNEAVRAKGRRPWQATRKPMSIEEIENDREGHYRVYIRRQKGVKFSRLTCVVSGEDAAKIVRQIITDYNDVTAPDFALSIREEMKGIVYEWFWSAERARREDEAQTSPSEAERTASCTTTGESQESPSEAEDEAGRSLSPRLEKAIVSETGHQSKALLKHLAAAGVYDWPDLTEKGGIYKLRDELRETCAPSTARTYMATMKGFLARHDEERGVCKDYRKILKNKADKAVRTYLTKGELQRVERCEILTERERLVRARFLIGAYTGMRISDAMEVSTSNVSHGMITYVAKKTGTEATVPCPRKVLDLIAYVKANDCEMSLMTYNKVLRIVCMKSGVDSTVKIHLGGETQEGPKWKFVSSHTARISFATNLANAGVPLIQLAGMMGHTSTQMTERYIANKSVQLSDSAMEYFA